MLTTLDVDTEGKLPRDIMSVEENSSQAHREWKRNSEFGPWQTVRFIITFEVRGSLFSRVNYGEQVETRRKDRKVTDYFPVRVVNSFLLRVINLRCA